MNECNLNEYERAAFCAGYWGLGAVFCLCFFCISLLRYFDSQAELKSLQGTWEELVIFAGAATIYWCIRTLNLRKMSDMLKKGWSRPRNTGRRV